MTTRDKHIAQKRKGIEKIARLQLRLIKKAAAIPVIPSKRKDVNFRRMAKTLGIGMQIRALEMQKQMIIAQPIPKVNGFRAGGLAIVGERGRELIVTNTGNVFIPGEIQTCPVGEMVHIPINWKIDNK